MSIRRDLRERPRIAWFPEVTIMISDQLARQGKRLPRLHEYAHMLLGMEETHDAGHVNQWGCFTEITPGLMFGVESTEGHYRLIPGPEFSPRLYRGQPRDYGSCKPSLYRNMNKQEQNYWIAKVGELACALTLHPALKDLMQFTLEGLLFDLDFGAIAQHYGYPTSFLDFSRSKEVAMFFAMCEWNEETGTYRPAPQGEALLYTVDLRSAWLGDGKEHGKKRILLPMGGEPLPRPEAQSAFALELGPDENLSDIPWVTCEPINRTKAMAEQYFELFDEGRALFSDTVFDQYIIYLRDNLTVWEPALGMAFGNDAHQIIDELRTNTAYRVSDNFDAPTPELVGAAHEDWQARRANYFSRIRIRGRADHYNPR